MDHREKFTKDAIFGMTLMATTQRGNLYSAGCSEAAKLTFRRDLQNRLQVLFEQYRNGISEQKHIDNIEKLAAAVSQAHPGTLNEKRFRIGSAQKALNLYLKYMWVFDIISMPPHCPFDYIILSQVPGCKNVKWTQFDDIQEYKRIVECARAAAKGQPLAEWELDLYNAAKPIAD